MLLFVRPLARSVDATRDSWPATRLVRSALRLRILLGIALACGGILAPAVVAPGALFADDTGLVLDDAPLPTPQEAVAARVSFGEAEVALKKSIGELTVLQAEYQKKGADRAGLEAKFSIAKKAAEVASAKLEQAAFTVARAGVPRRDETEDFDTAMPLYKDAVKVCGAMVATAIQTDDPHKALRLVDQLEKVGAIDGDVLMMGATASMLLSDLPRADAYIAKLAAVGGSEDRRNQLGDLQTAIDDERAKVRDEMTLREADAAADDLPRVRISTSAGDIVVELFENEAPNTVANFVSLVESGLYDGTPFHRVIPGFMAQGGDPTGRGAGGPGYAIACETGLPHARKHFLGTLSMAHAGKDTGGSQFFLTFRPTEHLDGKHTVFGRVIEGFEVLPKIQRTQNPDGQSVPGVKSDTILKAEVIRKRDHVYTPDKLPDPPK